MRQDPRGASPPREAGVVVMGAKPVVKPNPPFTLRLGVKRRLSRRNDPRERQAKEAFDQVRLSVLRRDNWTCQGCGFASMAMKADKAPSGGMEVHHLDDDHHHNNVSNLVTLCPFCHMSFTLGRRGGRFDAVLGYEPRYTQAELNLLHHTAWGLARAVSIAEREPHGSKLRKAWPVDETLKKAVMQFNGEVHGLQDAARQRLRNQVEENFPGIGDISALYGALQNLSPERYAARDQFLYGLRLFPQYEAFDQSIERWARHIWAPYYPPSSWPTFIHSVNQHKKAG